MSYNEAVNYLFETDRTDNLIAHADADMMEFTHPSIKATTEYSESLWNKTHRRHREFYEQLLEGISPKEVSVNPP